MSNFERTETNPLLDQGAVATGRQYISPCYTSSVYEFRIGSVLWLIGSVAGHGFSKPWEGKIEDINEQGFKVWRKRGKAKRCFYDASLELHNEHVWVWKLAVPATGAK
jgi:hypothetical protein